MSIRNSLKELESLSQTAQATTRRQDSLHADIQQILVTSRDVEHKFASGLRRQFIEKKLPIIIGGFQLFWDHIPVIPGWDTKSETDLRDGTLVESKQVRGASHTLIALRDAWNAVDESFNTTWVARNLQNMPKICIILRHTKDFWLLDSLIKSERNDSHLPFNDQTLGRILDAAVEYRPPKLDQKQSIESFTGEQYRAIQREWSFRSHIDVSEREPLPLRFDGTWDEVSGFANVDRVLEVQTQQVYARKVGQIKSSDSHLRTEFENLEKLGDHFHIVQLVKTYQRGDRYALLLKPAADHNLWKLLQLYCQYKFQRDIIKPALLRMFGCLSIGLDFIHQTTRHKDVKPQNVLFYNPYKDLKRGKISTKQEIDAWSIELPGRNPADSNLGDSMFLWADFGLSYNFSDKNDDKTRGGHQGTSRYAAPEYKEKLERSATLSTGSESARDATKQECLDTNYHGKEADIFSLGCVFLEVISVLLQGTLEKEEAGNLQHVLWGVNDSAPGSQPGTGESSRTLADNQQQGQYRYRLQAVNEWIQNQLASLGEDHHADGVLSPLLQLSQRMIMDEPESRPTATEIVEELYSENSSLFCEVCRQQCQSKFPTGVPKTMRPQISNYGMEKRSRTSLVAQGHQKTEREKKPHVLRRILHWVKD